MRSTMRRMILATATSLVLAFPALANEGPKLPVQDWSFAGAFGTYDRERLQKGWLVYKQVCATCHSMTLVSYRNLLSLGMDEEAAKAAAAEFEVTDGPNDEGEMYQRPARLSDKFRKPFANEKAARAANNGAYPPDLSLITKARGGGADYVYAILTGYAEPPKDFKLADGMNYNKYFPGHQIAMPPPLQEGSVAFPDNSPSTIEEEARNIVYFLSWAAEPKMEERKRIGVRAVLFLLIMSGMLYAVKRKVWAHLH